MEQGTRSGEVQTYWHAPGSTHTRAGLNRRTTVSTSSASRRCGGQQTHLTANQSPYAERVSGCSLFNRLTNIPRRPLSSPPFSSLFMPTQNLPRLLLPTFVLEYFQFHLITFLTIYGHLRVQLFIVNLVLNF